ncbi:MAG: sugar phosphate isomerase/epimerase [Clostridiales Family XIII bacterium]|jgi:sugar phosphate isomerase/epimerase|nr:sugar phosphate isomerase/epimerase [Clostridiales Family XIII bacterium]
MGIRLGMHADNWRGQSGNFWQAVDSAVKHELKYLEAGTVNGQYFVSALGYDPSLSILDNPVAIRRRLDEAGVSLSMLDASYPIFGPEGSYYGIQYYTQVIRFAKELGAPKVDSVDSGQAPDMPKDEMLRITIGNYTEILKWAHDYDITICIEPHGPYTGDGEFMLKLLSHFEDEHLRINFDTGNTFIQGHDPLDYYKELEKYIVSSHIKDVDPGLAAALRGEETGIGMSPVSIGEGVNADNIRAVLKYMKEKNFDGDVSIECDGSEENIRKSVDWIRGVLAE